MNYYIFVNRFSLLVVILTIKTICFSQPKTTIGLNLTGEKTSSADFVIGIGGTLERQINKHNGFETGLYYRIFEVHQQVFVDGSLYGFHTIKEKYLSIPILYKFYSSVINFSVGPTFDMYLGWKQMNKGIIFEPDRYTVNAKFHVGLIGKISKTIVLTNRFLLEPEIRYNPVFFNRRSFYGAGIACKYMLVN